jgi:large subunit ribosomal protein L29
MSLPKYKDLNLLSTINEIDQEIFLLQKTIFDQRIIRATNQANRPHIFKHTKRRIAQLKFKKSIIISSKKSL